MIQAHVPAEMHEVGKKHREENLHYSQMPNGLKEMPCTFKEGAIPKFMKKLYQIVNKTTSAT